MPAKIDPATIRGFLNEVDKAYAAGFFDGEGHVHMRKHKGYKGKIYPALHVTIGQTDPRPLQWLVSIFGGNIYLYDETKKNGGFSQWSIVGTRASVFLRQIRPFLRVKDRQVDKVLEEYDGR